MSALQGANGAKYDAAGFVALRTYRNAPIQLPWMGCRVPHGLDELSEVARQPAISPSGRRTGLDLARSD